MKRIQQFSRLPSAQKQQGAVLIVSLMVLLVLTLLAMSSSQTITLQEKMTAAVRDSHLALEQAEATLKEAEEFISNNINSEAQFTDSGGLFYGGEEGVTGGKQTNTQIDPTDETWWDDANNYRTVLNDDGEVKGKYTIVYKDLIANDDGTQIGVMLCSYNRCNIDPVYNVTAFEIHVRGEGRDSGVRYLTGDYGKKI